VRGLQGFLILCGGVAMVVRYIKGEKVYVGETYGELGPCRGLDIFEDKQIVRHNELIRALNFIFQQAEENPEKVSRDLVNIIHDLLLLSKEENHKPKVEILNVAAKIKEGFKFDGNSKVKRSKQLMLHREKRVKIYDKPKVIFGGLYKPAGVVNYDLLSDAANAWRREQAKTEHHDNA
jgi:hypothetical protein